MKITHVIESSGGSADFVLYLVKYLPNHEHTIIHSDRTFGNKLEEVKSNFPTTNFLRWNYAQREVRLRLDLKASIWLFRLLKLNNSDVIHVHSSKAGFLGRLVCFFLGKKNVIYTANGLSFLRQDVSSFKRAIYVMLERLAHAFGGKIVSCSRSEADALIKKGIPSTYINNGTEIFNCTWPMNPADHSMIIATTGRVTIQKNPRLFNQIAEAFLGDSAFQFIWIGAGERQHELTSGNIKITGWMDRSKVIQTLTKANIYISTASWEGLPFAVLEAMNIYKPLLLTRCVGNIDLVKDDYNGYAFDTAEEAVTRIKSLQHNKGLLNKFAQNSHTMAKEHFDVKKMSRQYEEVYISVL